KAYVQRTFLPFLQVSSGQSLLHDHLVRTPVKQVVKEHAEEKRGPGNDFGVDGPDRVQLLRRIGSDDIQSAEETPIAENDQPQHRDGQPADQQADAVDRVTEGPQRQSTHQQIQEADNAYGCGNEGDRHQLIDPHRLTYVENFVEDEGSRIQDHRQKRNHISENKQNRNNSLCGGIVAPLNKVGNRIHTVLQILRQKDQGQHDNGNRRRNFPGHHFHYGHITLAILADDLLRGQVGHDN